MGEATLLVYVATMMAIGIKAKASTLEEFILGDKLSMRAMVATIASTMYGGSAVLGGVSLVYQMGMGVIWFMVPFYLGSVAVVLVLGKITGAERYTLPDFLGDSYGKEFAIASSMLLATLCLVPEEIIAGGKILSALTPMPVELSMGIMAFVLVVPVVIGGMRADVRTDVVQFALMLFTLAMIAPFAFNARPDLPSGLPEGALNPFSYISVQEIALFSVLLFFLPMTSAPLYQRFFASESKASSRKAVLYSVVIWMAVDSIVILCGFAALSLFPSLPDPDIALIALGAALPAVGRGIFFVGLLAVIMSTVNSFLQSGASSLAYDAFRHLRPATGAAKLLALSRLFVILLGVVSLGLALWFQSIVPALLFTLSMWTAGILIPTLAALTGWRLSKGTALLSMLAGVLSCLAWKVVQPLEVDALFVGLGGSLLTAVALQVARRGSRSGSQPANT